MNNDAVKNFQKLLRLRTIFKQVSQLSWNVTQLEKRYPLDSLTDEEASSLISAYQEYASLLTKADDELRGELDGKQT
jgi:hypothetical protein